MCFFGVFQKKKKKHLAIQLAAVICEIVFSLVVFLTPEEPSCPWCTQHLIKSDVSWLFMIEALACLALALLAFFRPFKQDNPRPAAFILCMFWFPIYTVLAITLPVLRASYPAASDGGFCANLATIVFYYVLYPIVLYIVLLRDSRYIFANKLDDSLLFKEERMSLVNVEETTSLMREFPISGMVDLIGDKSLAIISWSELEVGRKLGSGGFGEGAGKARKSFRALCFDLFFKFILQVGMELKPR